MNVLITCAGRRVTLADAFLAATAARGGKLYVGDSDFLAPALNAVGTPLALPRIDSADYIPVLLRMVAEYRIGVLVPTIDTELRLLSKSKKYFEELGCLVVISGKDLIEISEDKWMMVNKFRECGVSTPASWLPGELGGASLPDALFIKPRRGSSSQDAFPISKDELPAAVQRVCDPVIQQRLIGEEITVDAFIDFSGTPIHYVPRKRIKTVGGESVQGLTICDLELREWLIDILHISATLGGVGPITIQAFLTEDGPILSEINPRFGGGFPLALAAGADYPEWILHCAEGGSISPRFGEYTRDLYMTRYYKEVFFKGKAS